MSKRTRKEALYRYGEYRRLGLNTKEAWKWAVRVAYAAKDHWHKPKCGW